MKQVCISFLIVTLATVLLSAEAGTINSDCGNGKAHNYYYGNKSYTDRLLYQDKQSYKSKWMRVTSVDVDYPPRGSTPLGNINYIEVLDQRSDGTNGCVYIKNGGVGNNYVTLHLKSQRNHGMDFLVNIYGH